MVVFGLILGIACSVDNSCVSQYKICNVFVVDQWRGISKNLLTIILLVACEMYNVKQDYVIT